MHVSSIKGEGERMSQSKGSQMNCQGEDGPKGTFISQDVIRKNKSDLILDVFLLL